MNRKQALLLYLSGTLGQILLASLIVLILRAGEVGLIMGLQLASLPLC